MFETDRQLLHSILRADLEFNKKLAKFLCCSIKTTDSPSTEIDNL